MRDGQTKTIFLKDYKVPDYLIDHTDLHFILAEDVTEVRSCLRLRKNPESGSADAPLVLDGQDMELKTLKVNGTMLAPEDYTVGDETLTIKKLPDNFTLECVTLIRPQSNTSLEGLYKSRAMFCTQCEAEGFRKITYYLDRPDVMSTFTTTIVADKKRYPVLLSNGNSIKSGEDKNGFHWVCWDDPFKKPAYLFALVAGDLQFVEDHFVTRSGCDVTLRIFVEAKDLNKCEHAMRSLIKSMAWDEQVYGREYDLSIFNIVAVDDFNMGAMENKSLNIFNTSCVLARPDTTSDAGFQRVESIVAHEYFHNWSGNRVTCRDWFQLSLKEGFTVFRDSQFSADMGSSAVRRVEDVSLLRTAQFSEDAGPMAHPVRPESYMEIANFYTVTIYEKGAEVVRMIHKLLGAENFRKGSDLYFDRHDGQAVSCEDFVRAMEDASSIDLTQFRRWYSQAGTPVLNVSGGYDEIARTYTLDIEQSCAPTPGQQEKLPFHIPVAVSLLGDAGSLPLSLQGSHANAETADNTELVLNLTEPKHRFIFENVAEKPVPSLLRDFSAPVRLFFDYGKEELLFLMANDSDGFCRWNACQQLAVQALQEMISCWQQGSEMHLDKQLINGLRSLLLNDSLDAAMVALLLTLPSEAYLAEISSIADVHAIHAARTIARLQIAEALQSEFLAVYQSMFPEPAYQPSAEQIAARSLKNLALDYLMLLETPDVLQLCVRQFNNATNMTDEIAAFVCLINSSFGTEKAAALQSFYDKWCNEALVLNQWLMVQAGCPTPGTLEHVKTLMEHPAFDIKNPNKVRALIGTFCGQNTVNFHQPDGAGYRFLADQVITLDKLNPQIAARLLAPLGKWGKYPQASQLMMKTELERILAIGDLSKDVYEVVSKSLK